MERERREERERSGERDKERVTGFHKCFHAILTFTQLFDQPGVSLHEGASCATAWIATKGKYILNFF